jgi:RimJ/RimL family protein N-acetyltransferase
MIVAETERLVLRPVALQDARFMLELMNQPSYHRFIGDRGVRDTAGALDYIQTRYIDSYQKNGFGLWAVVVKGKEEEGPVGVCGLVKREHLVDPDLGFAFLPAYWSKGYAREAAQAALLFASENLRLKQVLAVTSLDNEASIRLLEKVGFQFKEMTQFPGDSETLRLFERRLT